MHCFNTSAIRSIAQSLDKSESGMQISQKAGAWGASAHIGIGEVLR